MPATCGVETSNSGRDREEDARPGLKKRFASRRAAVATARLMEPSGPRIARPGPKIMHHDAMLIVNILNPMETDASE